MSKHFVAAMVLAGGGLAAVAQADTAVTENTTVGGKAFIDLTSLDQKAGGTKTGASGFGLHSVRGVALQSMARDQSLRYRLNHQLRIPVLYAQRHVAGPLRRALLIVLLPAAGEVRRQRALPRRKAYCRNRNQ